MTTPTAVILNEVKDLGQAGSSLPPAPGPSAVGLRVTDGVSAALDFALLHIGVCEDPVGSNRGPEIDAWATEFGSPLGSFWCALAVGKARKVGGLWIPTHDVGSCDEWVYQATRAGLLRTDPEPGAGRTLAQPDQIALKRFRPRRS